MQTNTAEALKEYQKILARDPRNLDALLGAGVLFGQAGRFQDAEHYLARACEAQPSNFIAQFNHGLALHQLKRYDEALFRYDRALSLNPNFTDAHYNRGAILRDLYRHEEALASFDKVLSLKADFAEAHNLRGNILRDLHRHDEALASYDKALSFKADHAAAHYNRGSVLSQLGRYHEALASYDKALMLRSGYAEAHNSRGIVLSGLHRYEEALASFDKVLSLKADFAEAHNNRGNVLSDLHRYDEALASYDQALSLLPDFTDAHNNRGTVLRALHRFDESLASFDKALSSKPDFAEAHNNRGTVLSELRHYDEALASFDKALAFKADYAAAHYNRGNVLRDLQRHDEAIASYERAIGLEPTLTAAFSNLLLCHHYADDISTAEYLDQAQRFGRIVARMASTRFSQWHVAPRPERLRVGLVSGDLRSHSVGHFLEGVLGKIDPSRVELIAYPTSVIEDDLTARIRPHFSAWKPLSRSDEAAAHLIHADGVHVLIDLSGHTSDNRLPLFAWKPAPVQVTWLGLPSTTGVCEIDYILGDPYAIPPEFDSQFTESVWRIRDSYLCLTVPNSSIDVAPLLARSTGQVTFGSFNNLSKMTDAVVAVWARILAAVPGSRLILKTKQLSVPVVFENTRQRFAAFGITPDRLILGGPTASRDDHLASYNKVDIALDTFPYPGVTTSAEALWMGVPVLSMRGNRFMSGTASSIAINAGLPDWIASDEQDYVAKAIAFSSDLEHLAALRANLRAQVLTSPLFDAPRFARNLEDALWGMWQAKGYSATLS